MEGDSGLPPGISVAGVNITASQLLLFSVVTFIPNMKADISHLLKWSLPKYISICWSARATAISPSLPLSLSFSLACTFTHKISQTVVAWQWFKSVSNRASALNSWTGLDCVELHPQMHIPQHIAPEWMSEVQSFLHREVKGHHNKSERYLEIHAANERGRSETDRES